MKTFSILVASLFLLGQSTVTAQEFRSQLSPESNILAYYVELFPTDFPYGCNLGQVDSAVVTQENAPGFTTVTRLSRTADELIITSNSYNLGEIQDTNSYTLPLPDESRSVDSIARYFAATSAGERIQVDESIVRFRSGARLDSLKSLRFFNTALLGTEVLTREYTDKEITETTVSVDDPMDDPFEYSEIAVYGYNEGGQNTSGTFYTLDEENPDPSIDYAYTQAQLDGNRYGVVYTDSDGTASDTLFIRAEAEVVSFRSREDTTTLNSNPNADPLVLLARLDDGTDRSVRRYLSTDPFGQLLEFTWYYANPVSAVRELPLAAGEIIGANPIQGGGQGLRYEGVAPGSALAIYDVNGRLVETERLNDSGAIAWPSNRTGVYYLVLSSPNAADKAFKWVAI